MAQLLYRDLPADEREDFESACKKYKWIPEDFDVVAEEGTPAGGGPGHIPRQVTVEAKATGHREYYGGGSGTSWTYDFEKHLEGGKFGNPPQP
ncbi:hypothetical protein D3C81_1587440 [compost metagenome]|uniref:hypothetical protein n=1 Tax=Cupriavidus campinensis TaxID=151783 RepID=UPI000F9A61FB|nr:hypothetical protein [Cupriavidus campinensis]